MKAFISSATEEKAWGGHARKTVEALGFAPFLAHHDIEVSAEWQKRIAQELSEAAVIVAILSRAFKASN